MTTFTDSICNRAQAAVRSRMLVPLVVVLTLMSLAGCVSVPDGVTVVDDFELQRYLGKWYEIARLDHPFERGLTRVTAQYQARSGGGVTVVNRGYDAKSGEWNEAQGKAYLAGRDNEGRLKVSFFGPFYSSYNILELDRQGYRYAMVSGPNRSYLWILARMPQLDPTIVDRLVARAAELGFPTEALIWVKH